MIELSEDVGFITEKELKRTRQKNKALDRMLRYAEEKKKEMDELNKYRCIESIESDQLSMIDPEV